MQIQQAIKLLKSNASYQEKLDIAKKLLELDIPGKDTLLLEWIVPTMYKHSTLDYWEFLLELIKRNPTTNLAIPNLIVKNFSNLELQKVIFEIFQLVTNWTLEQMHELNLIILGNETDIEIVKIILKKTFEAQTKSTNQKKVFLFVVQKLLIQYVRIHVKIPELMSRTICDILFHKEHLLEFVSVISQDTKPRKDMTSYPKHLFDLIGGLNELDFGLLKHVPEMLGVFSSKMKNNHHSCLFYCHLQPLLVQLYSKASVEGKITIVSTLTEMLVVLKKNLLYRPSNDPDTLKVYESLKSLFETLYQWVSTTPSILAHGLKAMKVLLSLDFKVIGDDLERIWALILDPVEKEEAIAFFDELFTSFVKLRQVPMMLSSIFTTIRERDLTRSECILLDSKVLGMFDGHVASMLPTQSFEILNEIKTELVEHYLQPQSQQLKKKKSNSKMFSSEIVSTLFIHGIQYAQVLESRKQNFDEFLCSCFELFVSPVLEQAFERKKEYLRSIVIPTLRIHLICLQASKEYWKRHCSVDSVVKLFQGVAPFEKFPEAGLLLVEIGCHCIDRLVSHGLGLENVETLVELIWAYELVPEKVSAVKHSHIWTLSKVSTAKQIQGFIKQWIKSVTDGSESELAFVEESPVFLEVPVIQKQILGTFVACLYSLLKKSKTIAAFLKPIYKNDTSAWKQGLSDRIAYQGEKVRENIITELLALVKLFSVFPVEYFQYQERDMVQWIVYLLERIAHESNAIELMVLTRKLSAKYAIGREDRLIFFFSFNILKWFIGSVDVFKDTTVYEEVKLITQPILGLVTKKLFERLDGSLVKDGSVTPKEYAEHLFGYIHSLITNGKGFFVIPFCNELLYYVKVKSSGSDKDYKYHKEIHKVFKALQQSLETITADLVIPMSNLIMEYQTLDNNEKAFKTLEKILGYYNQNPSLALECVVLSLKWKTKSVDYKDFENWFSLLWKGMNSVLLESVLNTFVSNTTFENYSILLDLHLNRPLTCFKDQKEASLFSLKSLVQHCGSAWKPKLASKWSLMLSRLAFICQTACHFIHVQSSLEIIVLVAKTTSYELKPAQLSFMFDLLSNLALNKNLKLTTLEQESLYELLYQVLYTIIRYRREEMLNLIPMFLLHVSAMIDCFAVQDLRKVLDKQFVTNPIVPLKGSLPNQNQAKMISRLLFQMTQKPLSGDSQKLQVIKPFAKHVPFLIFRLLYLQVSTKRNLGDEWKLSMYACLDACDDHGRNMVLAGLESNLQSLRPIYKHVVTEWEKEHRYHGKA